MIMLHGHLQRAYVFVLVLLSLFFVTDLRAVTQFSNKQEQDTKTVNSKQIPIEEAQKALKHLVESVGFLKDYPSFVPLKEFLQKENKDTPLTEAKIRIEAKSTYIGRWWLHPKDSTFGVVVDFAGNEFYGFDGKFTYDLQAGWTATITNTKRGHQNPGPGK